MKAGLKSDKTKLVVEQLCTVWSLKCNSSPSCQHLASDDVQAMVPACVPPSPSDSCGLCSLIQGASLSYDLSLLILFTMILYAKFYHPCVITSATNTQQAQERPSWGVNSFIQTVSKATNLVPSNQAPAIPSGARGKEPTCHFRRLGSDPRVGTIPWRGIWRPTPAFLPGESHGDGWDTVHRAAESDTTEVT